jgi:hypothetical protein
MDGAFDTLSTSSTPAPENSSSVDITPSSVQSVAETPLASESTPISPEGIAEDQAGITEDGEVVFGDKFFDDLISPEEPGIQNEARIAQTQQEYTLEEVQGIPFEQIDRARLPASVKAYLPAFDSYYQQRMQEMTQLQQYAQTLETQLQQGVIAPAQATPSQQPQRYIDTLSVLEPQQLTERARAAAAERLKIKPEEIDTFDANHVAALTMAATELTVRNSQTLAKREEYARDLHDCNLFISKLSTMPDYREFEQHILTTLNKAGHTPQTLMAYVARTGAIREYMGGVYAAYTQFRQAKGSRPQSGVPSTAPQRSPAARPALPKLESSGAAPPQTRKNIDLNLFGQLDSDRQAKLLEEAGYLD